MTGIRGLGDAYAFRRLLWLAIGTVLVPTFLLGVYGIYAVRNTRAALLQRESVEREAHLRDIARGLVTELERLDEALHAAPLDCEGRCEVAIVGIGAVWSWTTDPPEALDGVSMPSVVGNATTWVATADHPEPIGIFRRDGRTVAWEVDRGWLTGTVARLGRQDYAGDGVFELELVPQRPVPSLEDLRRRFQDPAMAPSLYLQPPLGAWRINLVPRESLDSNAWLYLLGLFALVITVVTGMALTLGSTMREIRLSRLQTDFVSSISHELRTPLTSIRMFVETLQSGRIKDPERVQEALDLLAEETDRLSRRIERVLNWARMEAGRRVYEVEEVAVAEIIDEALRVVKAQHLVTEVEQIQVEVPEGLPALLVDRDATVEALLNLMTNAVRYTPSPRRIVVSAHHRGNQVGLAVRDNGPGIPRRDHKRIWEKFYQGERLLSTRTDGSGLGLAIVRAVVQGQGGHVDLWSEEGQGSRFTLWLPAA